MFTYAFSGACAENRWVVLDASLRWRAVQAMVVVIRAGVANERVVGVG